MIYVIYKDDEEVNRIVADEDFCRKYYSANNYRYEKESISSPDISPIAKDIADSDLELAIFIGVNSV